MSSNDLIVDYYRRDLDPGEDEALARLLQDSPAEAERFARLAADEYRGFGLPEPGSGGRSGLQWGVVLLLAGAGAWAWMGREDSARQVLSMGEDSGGFEVVERAPRPSPPRAAADEAAPEAPAPGLLVSARTPQGPFDIQVSGAQATADGVYDGQGRRVAGLRAVDPRRFRWDGRDAAGRPAAPGAYQFRLRARGQDLRQWVEIEVR